MISWPHRLAAIAIGDVAGSVPVWALLASASLSETDHPALSMLSGFVGILLGLSALSLPPALYAAWRLKNSFPACGDAILIGICVSLAMAAMVTLAIAAYDIRAVGILFFVLPVFVFVAIPGALGGWAAWGYLKWAYRETIIPSR